MYRLFLLLSVMLATVLCLFLGASWYVPALAAAVLAALLPVWRRGGFYFAFLAGLMVWGLYAGYFHIVSDGRLGDRLAVTFGVATGWVLVLLTGVWGGLTTGLGGWFGASLRLALAGSKRNN